MITLSSHTNDTAIPEPASGHRHGQRRQSITPW
jgi:hypothetical protein